VVENLQLNGCDINVTASNVVIRNVKISIAAPEMWAIRVSDGGSATIDHVDISGLDKSTSSVEYAVLSQTQNRVTISRSNLHNCADCIQGENIVATGNYIHDLAYPPGAHIDGIQCNAQCGISVTGNTILNQYDQTSAVALFSDFGTPRNSTISGNLLAGGGYTIYGGGDNATGITITNNRFSRTFYPTSGYFGVVAHFTTAGNTWTNNIWDDTGRPVGN
jgi:hypothetical protein